MTNICVIFFFGLAVFFISPRTNSSNNMVFKHVVLVVLLRLLTHLLPWKYGVSMVLIGPFSIAKNAMWNDILSPFCRFLFVVMNLTPSSSNVPLALSYYIREEFGISSSTVVEGGSIPVVENYEQMLSVAWRTFQEVFFFTLHDGPYPMTVDLVSFLGYMHVLPLT